MRFNRGLVERVISSTLRNFVQLRFSNLFHNSDCYISKVKSTYDSPDMLYESAFEVWVS